MRQYLLAKALSPCRMCTADRYFFSDRQVRWRRRGGAGFGARPRRSASLREADCSALLGRAARRGNSLRSFVATLRQSRRVRQRSTRCARAAPRPALLDASHAPRSPRPRAFDTSGLARAKNRRLCALGKKGRRRGRRRAWEAPSSAGGRAARAARFVNLTRRDCLSVATKERSEFPRRALPPSSTGESGSRHASLTAEVARRRPRRRPFAGASTTLQIAQVSATAAACPPPRIRG